jgi:nitrous oxidase accessory protein NosD
MIMAIPRASKGAARTGLGAPVGAIVVILASAFCLAAADATAATRVKVATIAGLRGLPAPSTANVVAVSCHTVPGDGGGGSFRFDPLSSAGDNNGTVVAPASGARGRWLRIHRTVLSVRWFGARGDGVTFDTAAIQAAVDVARSGDTVLFTPGVYRIHADKGVRLKSDLRLSLGTATLVGGNVDGARCRLLEIAGKRNVEVSGGTLVGSWSGAPQWGVGILASDAQNLVIENVRIQGFHLDGILLTGNSGCRYVTVRNTVSLNNRRAGISIVAASDVTVTGSAFHSNGGQSPDAGVNVEPNAGTSVARVRIESSAFTGNTGTGIYAHRALGDFVADVSIVGNLVKENGKGVVVVDVDRASILDNVVSGHRDPAAAGIMVGSTTGIVRIADNDLVDNFRGIFAADANVQVLRNSVVGTGPRAGVGAGNDGDGILCRSVDAPAASVCVVSGNTVRSCAGVGILTLLVSAGVVADNVVDTTGQRGLNFRYTSSTDVRSNTISRAGLEDPGRYFAVELSHNSDGNRVTGNYISLGTAARAGIGVQADCNGNSVYGNVIGP